MVEEPLVDDGEIVVVVITGLSHIVFTGSHEYDSESNGHDIE